MVLKNGLKKKLSIWVFGFSYGVVKRNKIQLQLQTYNGHVSCTYGVEVLWILLSPQAPSIYRRTDGDPATIKQHNEGVMSMGPMVY